jgi:hypothetical protein
VQQGRLPFLGDQGFIVDSSFNLSYKQVSLIAKDLEPNAIMFQKWDVLYPYWYAANIEQGRTDLSFIEQNPYHTSSGFPTSTIDFIRANFGKHPIYLAAYQSEVQQAGFKLRLVSIDFAQFYKVEKP